MLPIIGASNETPIVVTGSATLDLGTTEIKIAGVVGNDAANGAFYIKAGPNNTFALYSDAKLTKPVAGTGAYQSGGVISYPLLEDYGIVVGINNYPALTALRGPEADAIAFWRWLVSPAGGMVALSKVTRILSSDYPAPDLSNPATWQPALDAVKGGFWNLSDLAVKNSVKTGDARVGRRLWVFLAGHGITPVKTQSADMDNSALLAATAAVGRYGEHLTAYSWIQWFKDAAAFDEIVLFMDCCRDLKNNVSPLPCTLDPIIGDRSRVRMLYAAATDLDSQSWEDEFGGQYHGLFSYALMQTLQNEALLDSQGRLTATNLVEQLKKEVKTLRKDQTPRFLPDPPQDITLWSKTSGLKPNVEVTFNPAVSGQQVNLFQGDDLTNPKWVHTVNSNPWSLSLDPFKAYKLAMPGGSSKLFEVSGDAGGNNVQFP
jgi:hypothetical protein